MPKTSKDFDKALSLDVSTEMWLQLVAIGYLTGNGGEYAAPARNFLAREIDKFIRELDEHERKKYQEILANVRIQKTRKLPGEEQKSPVA